MSKSILKNSFYNVIYRIINMIFPLFTTVIISHILMPIGVGKVASAQNIVTYFTLIACLGMPNYGTREIAKYTDNEAIDTVFSELFFINLFSTIMSAGIYYTIILFFDFFSNEKLLYIIAGFAIVLNVFNVDWFYQGKEEFKYIAIRSCIVKIVIFILTIVMVKDIKDYIIYAFLYCLGIAGNYIFNILHLRKMGVRLKVLNLKLTKHIKPIFVFFASSVAVDLYSVFDTTMLTIMKGDAIVGYYSNAMRLVKVAISLTTAIGGVLLPRISFYMKGNMKKQAEYLINVVVNALLFLILPAVAGLFIVSDDLVVLLFGGAFEPAVLTIRILVFLFFAVSYSFLFSSQVLIAINEEKKVLFSTIFGVVVNIIINLMLIPVWAQNGAAIASVISEMFVTSLIYHHVKKHFNISIEWKEMIMAIVGVCLMSMYLVFIKQLQVSIIIRLIISIIGSLFIYFISIKNQFEKLINNFRSSDI